jgi:hypothetical protein
MASTGVQRGADTNPRLPPYRRRESASRQRGQRRPPVLQELFEYVVAIECIEHVSGCVARRRACPASARQSQNVPVSYPRSVSNSSAQATLYAHLQGFSASPLTDSNRRPPPYHADPVATGRNPRQRVGLLRGLSRSSACHPVATACVRSAPKMLHLTPASRAYGEQISASGVSRQHFTGTEIRVTTLNAQSCAVRARARVLGT